MAWPSLISNDHRSGAAVHVIVSTGWKQFSQSFALLPPTPFYARGQPTLSMLARAHCSCSGTTLGPLSVEPVRLKA
jgi:hypothetical protein